MPVTTCSISKVSDALPNTYHHPIGPAAPLGMGWRIIGSSVSRTRNRASNQTSSALNIGVSFRQLGLFLQRILRRWQMRCLDLQFPIDHAPDTVIKPARRRTRGLLAVFVIDTAMARTHEQARLREPCHRTAQVGAVQREH